MKINVNKLKALLLFGAMLNQGCNGQPYIANGLWTRPDRIPVLCAAPNGGLLAFAEHRSVASDSGYINASLRRSTDNGTNWTPLQIVGGDGTNTFSCGAAVVDHTNGTVFFFVGRSLAADTEDMINGHTSADTKRIYLYSSTNSGTNWSGPTDISGSVKKTGWDFCDPGPATGIQLASGRLVVPWYYTIGTNYYSTVMYSDDHGVTWASSYGATNNLPGYNENNVVVLTNGNLMMIARNNSVNPPTTMGVSISTNSGTTWSGMTNSATLTDSGCEASFARYTTTPSRLLFVNPDDSYNRTNGVVRISYDEGQTWAIAKQYYHSLFGYSALAILPNEDWGLLAENGTSYYYDQTSFLSDTLSNLTGGADTLSPPRLNISPFGTNVLVSWPTSMVNYSLEETTNLIATNWTAQTGIISTTITNGRNQNVLSRTNTSHFFRLGNQ